MNTYHDLPVKEVEKIFSTDLKNGLSEKEVQARLKKNGPNALKEKKKKGFLLRFLEQFNDFMIIILLIAAAISFVTACMDGDGDIMEPIIILTIVVLNALLGVIQESRAEHSLNALKQISAPHARVLRGGQEKVVAAKDVVVGDILVLSAGDLVAADCRLVSANNLQADESSLTGESMPVEKNADALLDPKAPLGDRINLALSSTSITAGKGTAIVTKTGMDTEVGHIAGILMSTDKEQTPLQKKLSATGKTLGISALLICGVIFIIGLYQKLPPFEMFMTSVSLAVAAIPEGLPAIVTIMLAIGLDKMAKKGAIMRNLPSVETLGSASVICSDKTGTLTQNKMQITRISSLDQTLTLRMAALCSDSGNREFLSPTENAILTFADSQGACKEDLDRKYPRLDEIPFDSKRKRMSTLHRYNGSLRTITKGAIDLILPMCTSYYDGQTVKPLTRAKQKEILAENQKMADDALRVIAVAYADSSRIGDSKISESKMVFTGLLGISDPPRPEAIEAVSVCKNAGIRPVMITGDHVGTACAIAKEMGIMTRDTKAMTGAELEELPQEELEKNIQDYSVFARVTPHHKMRIVKAWKSRGAIVAMTGDGVNDAPALAAADIGCSMGKTGTDVAKSASDMILTDDNFATIVEAIRQGRGIFANIKKSVQFLLSSNIGEIITIFTGILFGWPSPLLAIQLLWVNLVTDSLPAIALGLDPAEKDIMSQPPRPPKKGLFADGLWVTILLEGGMIGALALLAFSIGATLFDTGNIPVIGRTMAFAVLSISELVHAFNTRSEHSVFSVGIFKNHYLVAAFAAGVFLQVSVIMVPVLAKIFNVVALSPLQWGIVGGLSLLPLVIVELQKKASSLFDGKHTAVKTEISWQN